MMPTFVCNKSIFCIDSFVTNFALVGHIEMLPMSTLNMVLDGVDKLAFLSTDQASMAGANVPLYKIL